MLFEVVFLSTTFSQFILYFVVIGVFLKYKSDVFNLKSLLVSRSSSDDTKVLKMA